MRRRDNTFFYPNKPIRIYDPGRILKVMAADDWIVQPKWDGKRVEIACSDKGEIQLYSREASEWDSEDWQWLAELNLPRPWFLDGELLRDGRIFVWDIAMVRGTPVFHSEYRPRLKCLQETIPQPITRDGNSIACIETLRASDYEQLLHREGSDLLEGLVWKLLTAKNFWGPNATSEVNTQFKFRFK